jgi:hypothetical protein
MHPPDAVNHILVALELGFPLPTLYELVRYFLLTRKHFISTT